VAELARAILGYPRHLAIHVGGVVLTAEPIAELVPVVPAATPGRTILQWDKDDVEAMGLVKIDLLGLGMLSLLQDGLRLVEQHRGVAIDLARLPPDDPAVYAMLRAADTVGVFQVESRAQMATLPRLQPRSFSDLVVAVALIRPGPIQGEMVHPYLRRRRGEEPVTYPHPLVEPVLRKTLGVPLFQEQGMKLAIVAAGFTPAEADRLRRAMGHKRSRARMQELEQRLLDGMARNGIDPETARRLYRQLAAFADYGFPESHAIAFAHLVYASAYLKCHYPAEFYCALLNNQPMGFYSLAVVVGDARRRGVPVLPVDVRRSRVDCTVEPVDDPRRGRVLGVRLGYRFVRGLGAAAFARLDAALEAGPFTSVADFCRRTGLDADAVEALILLGAFDALGVPRRQLLWQCPREQLRAWSQAGGLGLDGSATPAPALPPLTAVEVLDLEHRLLGLSPGHHPLEFLRAALARLGVSSVAALARRRGGQRVRVAGLAVCRQAPPTARGHVFLTLEDETGLLNLVVRPRTMDRYGELLRSEPLLIVEGVLQREQGATSVLVQRVWPIRPPGVGGAAPPPRVGRR
jgi:error-prone DNA polymerase